MKKVELGDLALRSFQAHSGMGFVLQETGEKQFPIGRCALAQRASPFPKGRTVGDATDD